MPGDNTKSARTDRLIADAIRNRQSREAGYREQALKIYAARGLFPAGATGR